MVTQTVVIPNKSIIFAAILPTYINMTEYKRQDFTTELRGALQEVKDHIEGKIQLQSLDSLLDEL